MVLWRVRVAGLKISDAEPLEVREAVPLRFRIWSLSPLVGGSFWYPDVNSFMLRNLHGFVPLSEGELPLSDFTDKTSFALGYALAVCVFATCSGDLGETSSFWVDRVGWRALILFLRDVIC